MSVLDRQMFNNKNREKLDEIVTKIIPEKEGTIVDDLGRMVLGGAGVPIMGAANIIRDLRNSETVQKLGKFLLEGREQGDDSTVYDFRDIGGGRFDLKEEGFQRVLRQYLLEGEQLFKDEKEFILSDAGIDAIEKFADDIVKFNESNRAMGSPITGEGINGLKKLDEMKFRQMGSPMQGEIAQQAQTMPQQNPANVGIMQGFEEDAEQMIDAGSKKSENIESAQDYTELMNSIRGDEKSEDERRDELAEIVGEKDANDTPDSVLTLVQPVIQMLDTPQVREEGIGATPQAFAMGGPVYRSNGTQNASIFGGEVSAEILRNAYLQSLRNTPGVEQYFMESLPLYQTILGADPKQTEAETLFNLSRSGFELFRGASPVDAAQLFFEQQKKTGDKVSARDLAIRQAALKGALGERAQEQAFNLAIGKALIDKKDTKVTQLGVAGQSEESDDKLKEDYGIDANLLPRNTIIQMDANNKITYSFPKTPAKEEFLVSFPTKKNGKTVFETLRLDINKEEDYKKYQEIYQKFMDPEFAEFKQFFKFERLSGVTFESPDIDINVPPASDFADGGEVVRREAGSNEQGEVATETEFFPDIGVGTDVEEAIEGSVPTLKEGSALEQITTKKLGEGLTAVRQLDDLYKLTLDHPEYFGMQGGLAQVVRNKYLGFDQLLNSIGLGLPTIEFLESPIIADIERLNEQAAKKIASFEKGGSYRSAILREIGDQKQLLNIFSANADVAADSIKSIRDELVKKINLDLRQINQPEKDLKPPDYYNQTPKEMTPDQATINLVKDLLPADILANVDSDPLLADALTAIAKGADPEKVIERYKELKKSK